MEHEPEFGELALVSPDGQIVHELAWQSDTPVPLLKNVLRLTAPVEIDFTQATVVAVIGLVVNRACAALLHDGHHRYTPQEAATLGKLKQPEAVVPLAQSLQDTYWQVRQLSARALGRQRPGAAIGDSNRRQR